VLYTRLDVENFLWQSGRAWGLLCELDFLLNFSWVMEGAGAKAAARRQSTRRISILNRGNIYGPCVVDCGFV
jgi:hypothetical protein